MDYNEMLDQSDEEAAGRLLATKILDLMDKLRLSNNDQAAKRWIWELLQNAKDVAYENAGVDISVDLHESAGKPYLRFQHNGQPFNAKSITFLIRQVSTKDRTPTDGQKKTTGKFGTGFLSTHLLSEKVTVTGIVKDEGLPYRTFSLQLDRSPTEIHQVISSVERTLQDIRRSLSSTEGSMHFQPTAYNTNFEYALEPAKVLLAQQGIADLHGSLPFTLAFSRSIQSVSVHHEKKTYKIGGPPQRLTEGIHIVFINEGVEGQPPAITSIVVAQGERVDIAIKIDIDMLSDDITVNELNNEQPKLFCDFPLIGSHDFPFPVVVNSPYFNPNEPRSAIWLTDVGDPRVVENKALMEEALGLYYKLLTYASKNSWKKLYNLIQIYPGKETDWLSTWWFDDTILFPTRGVIVHTPLVDNKINGRISIVDDDDIPRIRFPSSSKRSVREQIWDLASTWIPEYLPPRDEVHDWYDVIWPECDHISLATLAEFIQGCIDLDGLASCLGLDATETLSWLNRFYKVVQLDTTFRQRIINDEFSVIPNQNGVFQVRTYLKLAKQVDEQLKDVLQILGIDIRDILLRNSIFTGAEINYTLYNQQEIITHINALLQNSKVDIQLKYKACDFIVTLFAKDAEFPRVYRQAIYDFSLSVYPTTVEEPQDIEFYNADIFTEADKIQIRAIVQTVAKHKTLDDLTTELDFESNTQTLRWIDTFVEFLVNNNFESQLELKQHPILPNQNGEFTPKDNLNLDDGEIPEELKDISAALGNDFRNTLLDKAIFLEMPATRTTTTQDVANMILQLISPRLAEIPRTADTKAIFKQLYQYFSKYPEPAKELFKDLYVNKHKLFDDEEIAANIQKMAEVEQLFKDYNITDIEGLRSLLTRAAQSYPKGAEREKEELTKETLAALGITSEAELKRLVGEDPSDSMFRHISTPTPEMYFYAQKLKARARKNILAHLKTLPEYVFEEDELDELSPSVIGGIRKEGLLIHVVFRPSDNGQVLFYHPSEKATLDLANAELWTDDGLTTPSQLTLGKILTVTGINRIPIQ
jgi:hypothetical protein